MLRSNIAGHLFHYYILCLPEPPPADTAQKDATGIAP